MEQSELFIWIFSVTYMVTILILFLWTLGYKSEQRAKVDKKAHKLWIVYGIAMLLVDKPFKGLLERNKSLLEEDFRGLFVKDKIDDENYMYIVSKVALVLVIMSATVAVGLGINITSCSENNTITRVYRNNVNGGEATYKLRIDAEGDREEIELSVPPKKYTEQELRELLEKYREELIIEMLGENKDTNRITKPLKLVNAIGREKIPVLWNISDQKIIKADGSIGNHQDTQGTNIVIQATLAIRNISVTHDIDLTVYPAEDGIDIEKQLQEIVDSYSENEDSIPLPDNIGGKKVSYTKSVENTTVYFLILGIIAAIVIYVYKDKEIKKQVKDRQNQMLLDYPEIVSKIMLLTKAGMTLRKAWEMTVLSSGNKKDNYVYKEMKLVLGKINSGVSEKLAYEQFGKRCGLHCYVRFSNIIVHNLRRGSGDMCKMLENEIYNALQEKKDGALKQGEEAGTKLLIPMTIMLIIGLSLIIVPAFMSVKI